MDIIWNLGEREDRRMNKDQVEISPLPHTYMYIPLTSSCLQGGGLEHCNIYFVNKGAFPNRTDQEYGYNLEFGRERRQENEQRPGGDKSSPSHLHVYPVDQFMLTRRGPGAL